LVYGICTALFIVTKIFPSLEDVNYFFIFLLIEILVHGMEHVQLKKLEYKGLFLYLPKRPELR